MKNKQDINKMFQEAGILLAITIIAGLALGFVYELTKEPIAYQEALKVQNACKEVFNIADSFEEVEQDVDAATRASSVMDTATENSVKLGTIYKALSKDASLLGYVIEVTSTEGYNGNIEMMMGITMDGTLNGISLLSISETPGLGMRAQEVLVPQFSGKTVSVFTYTQTGAITDDQIDAISGATITTKAVTNAINTGLSYFEQVLKEGGN
ncbi:MAG TPA: RnfABCDGE type electron transport complex subunit G [Lachnospiraceae bacterium]|nr:RnfABCDGE type electron transport complex subunit G [Lachnospiraceae bacterium]